MGEWEEWSGFAFHLKRRLTTREYTSVGEAKDIRNTPEAIERHASVKRYLPAHLKHRIE